MSEKPTVPAALVIIGNEGLSGRTQDANVRFLAVGLNRVGVRLMEARVIADAENEIVEAINALRAKFDYVFTTGGIGPTHDDITADSVARAFGVPCDYDDKAMALLGESYAARGIEFNEARKRMARMPKGALLLMASRLVGPGVMEATKANTRKGSRAIKAGSPEGGFKSQSALRFSAGLEGPCSAADSAPASARKRV